MSFTGLHDYGKLIDFPAERRLFSLLDGRHRGTGAGSSHEFLDMAEYKPGDDISDIDWKTTARHNQVVVKRFESTATLYLELVADRGSNMAGLAPSGESKSAIVGEIAVALSAVASRRGDHVGLVTGNSEGVVTLPARSGISHSELVVNAVARVDPTGGSPVIPQLLRRAENLMNRRAVIFLVTDVSQITPQLRGVLRRLATRHSVRAMLVEDMDPTAVDGRELRDVSYGDLPTHLAEDEAIRRQWQQVREGQRLFVDNALKSLGIRFATVSSRADVLEGLAHVLGGGRRGTLRA